jgi:hypothetical protein
MGKTSTVEQGEPEPATVEAPVCQHHWIIETPRGATSMGRCKRCSEEREFRNSASDYLWEDESGSGYNAWRGKRSTPKAASEEDGEVVASPRGGTAIMV